MGHVMECGGEMAPDWIKYGVMVGDGMGWDGTGRDGMGKLSL